MCLEDGGGFFSVDLELHPMWRIEGNFALLVWRMSYSIYLEEGGEFCSDDLELHLHGVWRRNLLCWFGE